MNLRTKSILVTLAAVFVAGPVVLESAEVEKSLEKPNILFAIADDW